LSFEGDCGDKGAFILGDNLVVLGTLCDFLGDDAVLPLGLLAL